MQLARHWRLKSQRYRLQGFRYENGEISLQERPYLNKTSKEIKPQANKEREFGETSNYRNKERI